MLIHLSTYLSLADKSLFIISSSDREWMTKSSYFGCLPFKDMLLRLRDLRQAKMLFGCAHQDYRMTRNRMGEILDDWLCAANELLSTLEDTLKRAPAATTYTNERVGQAFLAYRATKRGTLERAVSLLEYVHVRTERAMEQHWLTGNKSSHVRDALHRHLVEALNLAIYR